MSIPNSTASYSSRKQIQRWIFLFENFIHTERDEFEREKERKEKILIPSYVAKGQFPRNDNIRTCSWRYLESSRWLDARSLTRSLVRSLAHSLTHDRPCKLVHNLTNTHRNGPWPRVVGSTRRSRSGVPWGRAAQSQLVGRRVRIYRARSVDRTRSASCLLPAPIVLPQLNRKC